MTKTITDILEGESRKRTSEQNMCGLIESGRKSVYGEDRRRLRLVVEKYRSDRIDGDRPKKRTAIMEIEAAKYPSYALAQGSRWKENERHSPP